MKKPSMSALGYGRKGLWVGAVTLVVFALLAGCSIPRRAAPIDRSILTDEPCAAPCWQRIVPGETTGDEAWSILMELEFLDHRYYPYRGRGGWQHVGWINWQTRAANDDPTKRGWIYVDEGVVVVISVALDLELTLQQVLDKYGAPEKLLSFQWGVERVTNDTHFYYPERGLIFVAWQDPVPYGEPGLLEATTPVAQVYYFEPISMDRLRDDLPEYWRGLPFKQEYLQDWQGLGPIEVLH